MRPSDRDERAADRYKIIAPLLDDALDRSARVQLRNAIAAKYDLDERTLRRWENNYRKDGFAGLRPAERKSVQPPAIPEKVLNMAIELRREVPKRSVQTIIKTMELQGVIPEGSIKRSTLQDALAQAGYSSAQMRTYAPDPEQHFAMRFEKEHRNECWQIDIKYGPYIDGKRTYLFSVIDDATRYICHSEFFMHQDVDALTATLRAAFEKCGIPKRIYLDNGKVFRSKQMDRAAAVLEIQLTYIQPYRPRGHGKIERFNNTVNGFLRESAVEKPDSLEKLNRLYTAWLDECYLRTGHTALGGRTPREVFEQDAQELRFADPQKMYDAFLIVERRRVNKTGCISLNNEQWEIERGSLMIGRQVSVLIDPAHPQEVKIECDGFPPSRATKLVIREHTGARPAVKPPEVKKESGSGLLRGAVKAWEKRQETEQQTVLRFMDWNNDGENS